MRWVVRNFPSRSVCKKWTIPSVDLWCHVTLRWFMSCDNIIWIHYMRLSYNPSQSRFLVGEKGCEGLLWFKGLRRRHIHFVITSALMKYWSSRAQYSYAMYILSSLSLYPFVPVPLPFKIRWWAICVPLVISCDENMCVTISFGNTGIIRFGFQDVYWSSWGGWKLLTAVDCTFNRSHS